MFFNEKNLRKIKMIFENKNGLGKLNFGTSLQPPITIIFIGMYVDF